MRDKSFKNGSVDREVINPLFGLLDEGVTVEFPGEVFDATVDLFEGLVNGDGTDGDGRVANDPLAGGVDIFPGGEIHHRVGSPLGGPAHLLDFLIDGRGDGGVSDVGIDFDEKISPDNHGLDLGVVDVCRYDGPTAGNLGAHEFRRDELGDFSPVSLAGCW